MYLLKDIIKRYSLKAASINRGLKEHYRLEHIKRYSLKELFRIYLTFIIFK